MYALYKARQFKSDCRSAQKPERRFKEPNPFLRLGETTQHSSKAASPSRRICHADKTHFRKNCAKVQESAKDAVPFLETAQRHGTPGHFFQIHESKTRQKGAYLIPWRGENGKTERTAAFGAEKIGIFLLFKAASRLKHNVTFYVRLSAQDSPLYFSRSNSFSGQTRSSTLPTSWSRSTQPMASLRLSIAVSRWSPKTKNLLSGT